MVQLRNFILFPQNILSLNETRTDMTTIVWQRVNRKESISVREFRRLPDCELPVNWDDKLVAREFYHHNDRKLDCYLKL